MNRPPGIRRLVKDGVVHPQLILNYFSNSLHSKIKGWLRRKSESASVPYQIETEETFEKSSHWSSIMDRFTHYAARKGD